MSKIDSKLRVERKSEALELINTLLDKFLEGQDPVESLVNLLAEAWVDIGYQEEEIEELISLNNEAVSALQAFSFTNDSIEGANEIQTYLLRLLEENDNSAARKLNEGLQLIRSAKARNAALVRANKPGGSVETREELCKIWASGKYDSRNRCAEEECAALGISFTTARKALIGTPDPDR